MNERIENLGLDSDKVEYFLKFGRCSLRSFVEICEEAKQMFPLLGLYEAIKEWAIKKHEYAYSWYLTIANIAKKSVTEL